MDLKYERKNVYKVADKEQMEKIYAFAEDYEKFLNRTVEVSGGNRALSRQITNKNIAVVDGAEKDNKNNLERS